MQRKRHQTMQRCAQPLVWEGNTRKRSRTPVPLATDDCLAVRWLPLLWGPDLAARLALQQDPDVCEWQHIECCQSERIGGYVHVLKFRQSEFGAEGGRYRFGECCLYTVFDLP